MNAQPELSFPSEPIAGETAATVELVGHDWRPSTELDWSRFKVACRIAEMAHGHVDANVVREQFGQGDKLGGPMEPRRFSAFFHRASSGKDAFLVADGWVTNTDHAGGNAGKPLRRYRLRETS